MDGFKKFVLRGSGVDLAVGLVVGVAFGAVVTAFVTGTITPLVGLAGSQNFDKLGLCLKGSCPVDVKTGIPSGHVRLYGLVLTTILTFLNLAAVAYFAVVRPVNRLMARRKTEPDVVSTTKACWECLSNIRSQQAAARSAPSNSSPRTWRLPLLRLA